MNVNVPLYVKGDLCLQNSAQVSGEYTVLQVGGTLTLNNTAHIGDLAGELAEVHVAGGCKVGSSTLHNPCGPTDSVYSDEDARRGRSQTSRSLRSTSRTGTRTRSPAPRQACTRQVGTPPAFDNDGVMNRSLSSAVDLTPGLAYDCQVRDAEGNLIGRLAWTPGSPGR